LGHFAGLKQQKKLYISVNYRNYGREPIFSIIQNTFGNELQNLKRLYLVDAYAEYAFLK